MYEVTLSHNSEHLIFLNYTIKEPILLSRISFAATVTDSPAQIVIEFLVIAS